MPLFAMPPQAHSHLQMRTAGGAESQGNECQLAESLAQTTVTLVAAYEVNSKLVS